MALRTSLVVSVFEMRSHCIALANQELVNLDQAGP